MGGYRGPASGGPRNRWTALVSAEFWKKVRNPPADGPAGGISPLLFFFKIGDRVGWISGILLKKWPKRGVPHFGHFLGILDISGENGVPYWLPGSASQ